MGCVLGTRLIGKGVRLLKQAQSTCAKIVPAPGLEECHIECHLMGRVVDAAPNCLCLPVEALCSMERPFGG